MELGELIKIQRKTMDLGYEKAAKMIRNKYGVKLTGSYLSMIEKGTRKNLNYELEMALKDFFNIDESKIVIKINAYQQWIPVIEEAISNGFEPDDLKELLSLMRKIKK